MDDKNQIAYYILAGVIKRCRRELALGKKLNITLNSSVRDVFAKAKTEMETGNELVSFIALRPNSMEITEGGDTAGISSALRPYALAQMGLTSVKSKKNNMGQQTHVIRFGLIPVKFMITVWFASPSFEESISFFSRWAYARIKRRLTFDLDWMKNPLTIEIKQSSSFSIPEREDRWESSDYSIYEGDLEVSGYISSSDSRDVLSFPTILELEPSVRIN